MEEVFKERKKQAEQGRIYWNALIEQYKVGAKQYVLALYTEDFEYVAYSMKHADAFLKSKGAESMLVLTDSPDIGKLAEERIIGLNACLVLTKEEMENLLVLYCLYEFTDRLLIGGVEEIPGRTGSSLIGKKSINKEEFVKATLYNITKSGCECLL